MEKCGCGTEKPEVFDGNNDIEKLKDVFEYAEESIYEYHSYECKNEQIRQLREFQDEIIKKLEER
jgi:hypothetical protein